MPSADLPILGLFRTVAAALFGYLVLVVICTCVFEKNLAVRAAAAIKRWWIRTPPGLRLVATVCGITGIALFVLGQIGEWIGERFQLEALARLGDEWQGYSLFFFLAALWPLSGSYGGTHGRRIGSKWNFMTFNNHYKGVTNVNVVQAGNASKINQTMQTTAAPVLMKLEEFRAAVNAEVADPQVKSAIERGLETVADECSKSPGSRDHSRLKTVLKQMPTLIVTSRALLELWSKLEPFIRTHLH